MGTGFHRNLHPQIVIKPSKLTQVAPLAQILGESTVDFAIRNEVAGSASSRDILISLGHLRSVSFDQSSETLKVGSGALWKDVNEYLPSQAPDWAVVGPRSSFTGVVGVTLIGGLSHLSDEFGQVSDPKNMLHVQIALGGGRLNWASEDRELLWTMRAGRCAFGIITALKLRARKLNTQGVYSGWLLYPMSKIEEVSKAVAKHLAINHDPKLSITAYILSPNGLFLEFDPGVSAEGFKWAFNIEGGQVMGGDMTIHRVNQQLSDSGHSKYAHWDATGLVDEVDEYLVIRARDWYYSLINANVDLKEGSYSLLEFCNPRVFGSTRPDETAWPHGKPKHVLQLGVGYTKDKEHLKALALEKLAEAFKSIPKTLLGKGDFQPTWLEHSIMDVKEMYGSHYAKLESIADRYDPKNRFRSLFNLDPNSTWAPKVGA